MRFFYLNHLIVNSVSFQIKITKNNSNFYLMGDNSGKFAFVFDEVFLRINRQVISPSVTLKKKNGVFDNV